MSGITGQQFANAALTLLGTRFRLHGRDPGTALDCVGMVEAALLRCGIPARLPNHYALRARTIDDPSALLARVGLISAAGGVRRGDLLMLQPHPLQHHFAIATGADRMVHAHAGLRRVVEARRPADWPLVRHWRFAFQGG